MTFTMIIGCYGHSTTALPRYRDPRALTRPDKRDYSPIASLEIRDCVKKSWLR